MATNPSHLVTPSFASFRHRLNLRNIQRPNSEPLKLEFELPELNDGKGESTIIGIQNMKRRLEMAGGTTQQDRMIYDKRKTLDRALIYSYQGANIRILGKMEDDHHLRALINPDKLKMDYDDKILSVPFEVGIDAGDVFEWLGTGSYWLVYLQDLDELAYFRSEIRRCRYEIQFLDDDGNLNSTWAAVRGPVETKINYIQKHQISVDRPNYSLHILMPGTKANIDYFTRYSKFYLKDSDVCWRVEATDWISTPNVLEISAVEYYANEAEDSDSIAGNLVVKKQENPNNVITNAAINGPTFITPKTKYEYIATCPVGTKWTVDSRYPVRMIIDPENPRKVSIEWLRAISGQFELTYNGYTETIVVESLF